MIRWDRIKTNRWTIQWARLRNGELVIRQGGCYLRERSPRCLCYKETCALILPIVRENVTRPVSRCESVTRVYSSQQTDFFPFPLRRETQESRAVTLRRKNGANCQWIRFGFRLRGRVWLLSIIGERRMIVSNFLLLLLLDISRYHSFLYTH